MFELYEIILALGIALSIGSIADLIKSLFIDYRELKRAKLTVARDPNLYSSLEELREGLYEPKVTIKYAIATLLTFGIPVLNLLFFVYFVLLKILDIYHKNKHRGVIDW